MKSLSLIRKLAPLKLKALLKISLASYPLDKKLRVPLGPKLHFSTTVREVINGGPLGHKTLTLTYRTFLAEKRTPFLQKYEIFLVT